MVKVADYLMMDRTPAPSFMLEQSTQDLGNDPVPVTRYTSQEWHDQEMRTLWQRTWQMACRENEVPVVGEQFVYDIGDESVIIVRSAADEIKAFHNSCRHRGNRLVEGRAKAREIVCSFHAWSWNLDGSLKRVPCRWDFPTVDEARYGLVEVRAERWNGLVFINFDPEAKPLDEFIGPDLARQFQRWPKNRAQKVGHVAKVVPCNWKAAIEAFLESYHSVKVHPQLLAHIGDANSQYDFYGPHARMLVPTGTPSPHIGELDHQKVVDAMIEDAFATLVGKTDDANPIPQVGDGETARSVLSDFMRDWNRNTTGADLSGYSDAEVLDAIEFFVFPNLVVWGGFALPVHYRARPNGNDPNSSIWEVMVVVPLPDGVPLERDAPLRMTPTDEPWGEAPELGQVGPLMDQDMLNLMRLQRGMRSRACQEVLFSNYQERNIRNFHRHLGAVVDGREAPS